MHCFTQDLTQCRGEITIGVAETLLCYRLPPLLKAFHRRAPQVKALGPDFVAPDHQVPLPFLINEPNSIFRQMFEGYLRERAIRMDHTIELGSIPTIKHLVENEVGVTFLPRFAVEDALAAGRLVELETGMEEPVLSAVCAHHKSKWISPLMACFLEIVTAAGV